MKTFDYTTIIGRSPSLWRWHVDNVLRNAGLARDLWTFNVVIYYHKQLRETDVTDELISICEENDINYQLHYEDPNVSFIERLYDCWNLVQEIGDRPYTLRGGSDQAWYKNSFDNIFNVLAQSNSDIILQAQTIESPLAGASRHFVKDFGSTPEDFNEEEFNKFCKEILRHDLFYFFHLEAHCWRHIQNT